MRRPGTDLWRLPAVPAPDEPRKGMRFWVQEGTHWSIGHGYSISRVNGASFYVASQGTTRRHPLREWRDWLAARRQEGTLLLEGAPVGPPQPAPLGRGLPPLDLDLPTPRPRQPGEESTLHTTERDARVFRAVREVLRGYHIREISPKSPGGVRSFGLGRKTQDVYTVTVDPAWRQPPRCTCPDAKKRFAEGEGTFCKHTVAVLVSHPELRHQLIDFLL